MLIALMDGPLRTDLRFRQAIQKMLKCWPTSIDLVSCCPYGCSTILTAIPLSNKPVGFTDIHYSEFDLLNTATKTHENKTIKAKKGWRESFIESCILHMNMNIDSSLPFIQLYLVKAYVAW